MQLMLENAYVKFSVLIAASVGAEWMLVMQLTTSSNVADSPAMQNSPKPEE